MEPYVARTEVVIPTIRLAAVTIDITPNLVTTTLPDGGIVQGAPHATPEYARHAAERGYGDDVARSNRCHEVAHSLLAYWLGLKCSPTLLRVSRGQHEATDVTGAEEAAVLEIERFANVMGLDLERVAADVQPNMHRALSEAAACAVEIYRESTAKLNAARLP